MQKASVLISNSALKEVACGQVLLLHSQSLPVSVKTKKGSPNARGATCAKNQLDRMLYVSKIFAKPRVDATEHLPKLKAVASPNRTIIRGANLIASLMFRNTMRCLSRAVYRFGAVITQYRALHLQTTTHIAMMLCSVIPEAKGCPGGGYVGYVAPPKCLRSIRSRVWGLGFRARITITCREDVGRLITCQRLWFLTNSFV